MLSPVTGKGQVVRDQAQTAASYHFTVPACNPLFLVPGPRSESPAPKIGDDNEVFLPLFWLVA